MKCPHCLEGFHEQWTQVAEGDIDSDGGWRFYRAYCPDCGRLIFRLDHYQRDSTSNILGSELVRPRAPSRAPLSGAVPLEFTSDYREACLVLNDSPKASAALSRRCLQYLLREKAAVKPQDLSKEIDEALPHLPSYLAAAVDAVRNVGNFAAHPIKSSNTGEILDVEPGEAEWLLDVLEGLFDFYLVQPATLQRKRDALNAKLQEAGKPPMKDSPAP